PPPPAPPPPTKPHVEEIIRVSEVMPLFPGCEDIEKYSERKKCADKRLINFIYEHIQYPPTARDVGIEGFAVISFTVEKDGSISEAKIVRDPGGGTGTEALRVVNLMNTKGIKWEPGLQMNKPVRVRFNLPVKFKL
ncbi:MAG: energy transducer TonB, partial [Bacteroidota bacterium]